ncbi:hypothetical protein Tco_1539646 [Tanacetum coccineum]
MITTISSSSSFSINHHKPLWHPLEPPFPKPPKDQKLTSFHQNNFFVDLTHDDTKTSSPEHQLSSPSAPNAPSKTPSIKGTSSSSIDYTPKSPTSSTLPSINGYLNSPTSAPPRVPPPPPTQENTSIDITLTLSPITHLMSNLILHHLLYLSLVISYLITFLRHMETPIHVFLHRTHALTTSTTITFTKLNIHHDYPFSNNYQPNLLQASSMEF